MSNIWFIGDIHGGHRNVHKFRKQFQSEEDHYQHVKDNFHKVVKKRDKVFFMGDTAFTLERLQDISNWVCGRKVLICGNHDTDHIPMKVLCEYFDEVYSLYKWHEFWLSHCPIHPDELRGKVNIHGHVHHATLNDKRYYNTSLENTGFYPVDLNFIRSEMVLFNCE